MVTEMMSILTINITKRHKQLLEMMAEGMPYMEIANRLGISIHTVKNHATDIRRIMGARNTVHAVAIAFREGLLKSRGKKGVGREY